MDLHGRITAHVWGKIIPKEASDCADFILEIPAIMETRQALADVVAAAEPAVNTMAILLNAIGGQSGSPADVDRTKLYDAIERARKVMKEEK